MVLGVGISVYLCFSCMVSGLGRMFTGIGMVNHNNNSDNTKNTNNKVSNYGYAWRPAQRVFFGAKTVGRRV